MFRLKPHNPPHSVRSHWKETARNPKRQEISIKKHISSRRRAGCELSAYREGGR